jgi:membrane protease YdiL (CAAX protease family)
MDNSNIHLSKGKDNAFVAVCAIYLVVLLSFVLLRIVSGLGGFDKLDPRFSDILFSILSQIVIMFLIPVVGFTIYLKKSKARKEQQGSMTFAQFAEKQARGEQLNQTVLQSWGFKKPSARIVGYAILLGFLLFFFNVFVGSFANGILGMLGYRFPTGGGSVAFTGVVGLLIGLMLIAVLPGICEEVAHRGLLLRGFAARIGIMKAVMFSSIIFGLMHLNIVQAVYAAVLGYMMALAVLATRNIWTAVIMHFMNNAIGVCLSFASGNLLGDLFGFVESMFGIFFFIIYILIFIGVYMGLMAIIHKFARENYIKDHAHTEEGAPPIPAKLKGGAAVKFYLTVNQPVNREPLRPLEKALFAGIIFLGTLVTAMTLVWGFL